MGRKRQKKKISFTVKVNPFAIERGKDPSRQLPGAGAHRIKKKEKPSRWNRRNPKSQDE